jgi:hypothetical protein
VDVRWRAGDRLSVRMGPEFRWNEDNGQWLANLDEDGDGAPDRFIYGELESRVLEWATRFDLLFSDNKPFCDGSHRPAGFEAESEAR